MSIVAKNICLSLAGKAILQNISVEVSGGQILGLIGPNGSGKSTLMKLIAGDFTPSSGQIMYDGLELKTYSLIERARFRSVMSQSQEIMFDFSVEEIIEMGIVGGYGIGYDENTSLKLDKVIKLLGIKNLLGRKIKTLSGGERQIVHIARAIIQIWCDETYFPPRFILMDEPTSSLDIGQEIKIIEFIRKEVIKGLGAIIIFHDLNLAAHFADSVAVLVKGKLVDSGKPSNVLTPALLEDIYGLKMRVSSDPFYISHF